MGGRKREDKQERRIEQSEYKERKAKTQAGKKKRTEKLGRKHIKALIKRIER